MTLHNFLSPSQLPSVITSAVFWDKEKHKEKDSERESCIMKHLLESGRHGPKSGASASSQHN